VPNKIEGAFSNDELTERWREAGKVPGTDLGLRQSPKTGREANKRTVNAIGIDLIVMRLKLLPARYHRRSKAKPLVNMLAGA
jgi:hypothetical protein